jgi:chemotaxis regulatin CheY-phosphate phosphatase CheZ
MRATGSITWRACRNNPPSACSTPPTPARCRTASTPCRRAARLPGRPCWTSGEGADGDWRALAERTVASLAESREAATATRAELMDIMMAQDFQDLTGQVIGDHLIAQNLEKQLVQVLVDFAPSEIKRELDNGLLNGPQIKPEGNSEVVADQGQVDDLLDSLGF